MTKSIRNILISILGAVFILCACLCFMSPTTVRADGVVLENSSSDDNFRFVQGASVPLGLFDEDPTAEDFDLATARTRLKFRFKLKNIDRENLDSYVDHPSHWLFGDRNTNVFIYEFTLHRSNRDGDPDGNFKTLNPQHSVLVVIYPDSSGNFYGYVAEKDYYTNSKIAVSGGLYLRGSQISLDSKTWYDDIAEDGDEYHWGNTWQEFGKNYVIKEKFRLSYNNLNFAHDDGLVFDLTANIDSPFQYYYITMRYCYDISNKWGTTSVEAYGEINSSARSVANVIQRLYEQGEDLDEIFGDRAEYANAILNTAATTRVRIKYLEEIPGTPYATHKYEYVNVPVLMQTIRVADVEAVLGESFDRCLDSNAVSFKYNEDTETYEAYYLKNVWLRSMTVDGNYLDYFLDINQSYWKFYQPYVQAGALSQDTFEWIYSQKILNKYTALRGHTVSEIYGYFGMVIIPKSYSLNSVLKDMFDIKTSQIGIISNFSYEGSLSDSAYNSLMSDYGYNWLAKAWSKVGNWLTGEDKDATFYVIYSEPDTESGLIGEGGQENPDDGSIIKEKVAGPVMQIVGDVWKGITGVLGGIAGNFKTILYIALAVVLVIIGFKVYNGIKGNNRRRK